MQLSSEQVLALAPDSASAIAGRKLNQMRYWRNLGQNALAFWGECQGSALYQVRVERATLAVKCTCPSRKFPCKHGLGLLLLAIDQAGIPDGIAPNWVTEWLAKRTATSIKPEKRAVEPTSSGPTGAQRKRSEKRE